MPIATQATPDLIAIDLARVREDVNHVKGRMAIYEVPDYVATHITKMTGIMEDTLAKLELKFDRLVKFPDPKETVDLSIEATFLKVGSMALREYWGEGEEKRGAEAAKKPTGIQLITGAADEIMERKGLWTILGAVGLGIVAIVLLGRK